MTVSVKIKSNTLLIHLNKFIELHNLYSFSLERMTYLDQEAKVIYNAKNGKPTKVFDALEWLTAMCSHIPNRGEQMVRSYGHFSNVSRGKRQSTQVDDLVPCIIESAGISRVQRKKRKTHFDTAIFFGKIVLKYKRMFPYTRSIKKGFLINFNFNSINSTFCLLQQQYVLCPSTRFLNRQPRHY